jgi:hypothetical protein
MTPNLRPEWARELQNNGPENPPLTVRQLWDVWRHIAPDNPYVPGTPEAAEWRGFIQRDLRSRVKRYTDSYPLLKPVKRPSKRRLEQPTLKPMFATFHDLSLRLQGTFIFIGSDLYRVYDMRDAGDDYILIVQDKDGANFHVFYNECREIDLRTPEPQYIQFQRMPVFLYRTPSRSQRQGICAENTLGRCAGTGDIIRVTDQPRDLMAGISTDILPWSSGYTDLMRRGFLPSMRLSKNVAVYTDKKGEFHTEYRGRYLGELRENVVFAGEHDSEKPWIRAAVNEVACELRRG